jgi:hypothetical protein
MPEEEKKSISDRIDESYGYEEEEEEKEQKSLGDQLIAAIKAKKDSMMQKSRKVA